jgi:hypothetical protein
VANLKKLIIHPGFHKTGTTALQQALSEVRHELHEADFNYPHIAGNAHHRAAWSVIEKTWGWKKRGGRLLAPIEFQKLENKLKSSKSTSIISSEFFSEADPTQLAAMAKRLSGFDVQVIFTWRPLPFMLASSYQQYLKYGVKKSYAEWLDSIFAVPGEAKFTPSFWKRNLHGDVVARWAETFGKENISLLAVDESNPNYLYETFAELAGIPKGILKEPAHMAINRSLTFTEAALLLEINRTYPKDLDWDSYEIFIRKGNIKALTRSDKHDPNDEKILTPEWAIAKAAELNLQNVAKIKSLGIKVIGNLDRNDFSKIPIGLNTPVTTISIETVARAMIGVDMSSLHKMHGKAISKEFFHRLKKIVKARLHLN